MAGTSSRSSRESAAKTRKRGIRPRYGTAEPTPQPVRPGFGTTHGPRNRARAPTRRRAATNRSAAAAAGQTGTPSAPGSPARPTERNQNMLPTAVLAIAGTGFGLIGLLVIILLVVLI